MRLLTVLLVALFPSLTQAQVNPTLPDFEAFVSQRCEQGFCYTVLINKRDRCLWIHVRGGGITPYIFDGKQACLP